jgi:hypothetical protein
MKKLTLCGILISLIMISVLLPGCSRFASVTGTGNVISKQYSFANFTAIEISNSFELAVAPLNSYSVSIDAYENLFDYVNISQSGNTLKIGLKPISYKNANFKATVTLPTLKSLNLSGASHGSATGFKFDQDFGLTESGSSFLNIDIEAGNTTFNISGGSTVTGQLKSTDVKMNLSGGSQIELSGSANILTLTESGGGQANLTSFELQNASVSLSGGSKANIIVDARLDVNLTGGSSLNYLGNPTLGKTSLSGASELNGKTQP